MNEIAIPTENVFFSLDKDAERIEELPNEHNAVFFRAAVASGITRK